MSKDKYKIDVKQAAKMLDVSKKTIYRRLKSGELDGKKVDIGHTKKWIINENDINKAKQVKESVDVVEVEEKISKQDLMNELVEAVNSQNKQVIQESMEKVTDKIDQQNKAIQEVLKENKEMRKELQDLKEQQNKSLWDNIKNILNF